MNAMPSTIQNSTSKTNDSQGIDAATAEYGMLRFITAGSVDDGKSTLIGRLLFDSKGIFADQLAAISKAKHKRVAGDAIDFSLLTDGLEAEREQGITIDVAYRYFATPKRKFIVADCPGHEQYTRNMVTGASTADAAIVLVDITRVIFSEIEGKKVAQLLPQTKRHTAIAGKLGLSSIVFAVNKMDLVEFDEGQFKATAEAVQNLANTIGIANCHVLPISALGGDNVVQSSANTPWYVGPSLLDLLEVLPAKAQHRAQHRAQHKTDGQGVPANPKTQFRFPVQLVARHDGHTANDFRGYMGRIESGSIAVGDTIKVMPAGTTTATITRIVFHQDDLQTAQTGQCVTLVLDRDVDVSRGDCFILNNAETEIHLSTRHVVADVCWLDAEPLNPSRKYWLKHTTKRVQAKIQSIEHVLDIHTLLQGLGAQTLQMNDIAKVQIALAQPIVADAYSDCHATGSFILIDASTHQTVAAGMVLHTH